MKNVSYLCSEIRQQQLKSNMELILTILVLALAYLSFRNYLSNNSTDDDDDDLDHLYED